jgi:undecaprenyl pyrophosphate phosphatase UppP
MITKKTIREFYSSKDVPYQINAFIIAFAVAILCIGIFTHLVKGDALFNVIRSFNFQLIATISVLLIIFSFLPAIVVKLTHIILLGSFR